MIGSTMYGRKSGCISQIVSFLRYIFMDLRFMMALMCLWLCIVIFIMIELGVFANSTFMSFGPRPELSFMRVAIDTYYKYNMLILLIILHTFITDFIADSLSPHVLNVVQDTTSKYIPHKPSTYFTITTIWAIYCSISQLFAIFIAFAQIDLLLVRMCSDIIANLVTTSLYLQEKIYDKEKFRMQDSMTNGHKKKKNYGNLEEEMNELSCDATLNNNNSTSNNNNKASAEEAISVRSSISFDGCDRDHLLANQESKRKKFKIFAFSKKNKPTFTESKFQQIKKDNSNNKDHGCDGNNDGDHSVDSNFNGN